MSLRTLVLVVLAIATITALVLLLIAVYSVTPAIQNIQLPTI